MPGARGEAELQANGRTLRVLFTNRALAEAEAAIGKGIIGVAQGFDAGTSGVLELAQLLRAGMEAARRDAREGGRPISMDEAYAVLDEVGFSGVAEAVFLAVAAVLSYDGQPPTGSPQWGEGDDRPNP